MPSSQPTYETFPKNLYFTLPPDLPPSQTITWFNGAKTPVPQIQSLDGTNVRRLISIPTDAAQIFTGPNMSGCPDGALDVQRTRRNSKRA